MKMVKSLLLGAAAGIVAFAGAQAADLPTKAKPVQYVGISSFYYGNFGSNDLVGACTVKRPAPVAINKENGGDKTASTETGGITADTLGAVPGPRDTLAATPVEPIIEGAGFG